MSKTEVLSWAELFEFIKQLQDKVEELENENNDLRMRLLKYELVKG